MMFCKKCKLEKDNSFFIDNKRYSSGKHPYCKKCQNEIVTEYRRTKKGLCFYIYHIQCRHSKKRKHPLPIYTKQELKDWILSQSHFQKLYNDWVESGFKKDLKPSIDRKDDYKPYSLNNIELMTWKENNIKSHNATKLGINNKRNKSVIQLDKENKKINLFASQHIASKETGVNQSDISSVCRGKRKTAGGFKWAFVSVIVMLFSINMYSQNTDITPKQKERIDSIFTAEKIIQISKGLSNEERQRDSIISLQKKIKSLNEIIDKLKEEHVKTLTDIAKSNAIAKEATKEVDDISDEQLKRERLKWAGLHLYGGIEAPKFDFDNLEINSELMYEFRKFHFGIKTAFQQQQNINSNSLNFQYFLKLRYKFF